MKTKTITMTAMIAALYVILTLISHIFGLASGAIQFRLSEALTILPLMSVYAIPGLSIGCLIANIITGCSFLDVLLGTAATFLGALGVYLLKQSRLKLLSPIFPIVSNTLIVSFIIWISVPNETIWLFMLEIFIGEFVCCGLLGNGLYVLLNKSKQIKKYMGNV